MYAGQLSEDGKSTSCHRLLLTIDSKQLNQVAMQAGVDPVQLGQTAPYFDQNQDGPPIPPIPPRVNGSDFEQQEEGKPWQIKVLSILIIIMASLGGTIV